MKRLVLVLVAVVMAGSLPQGAVSQVRTLDLAVTDLRVNFLPEGYVMMEAQVRLFNMDWIPYPIWTQVEFTINGVPVGAAGYFVGAVLYYEDCGGVAPNCSGSCNWTVIGDPDEPVPVAGACMPTYFPDPSGGGPPVEMCGCVYFYVTEPVYYLEWPGEDDLYKACVDPATRDGQIIEIDESNNCMEITVGPTSVERSSSSWGAIKALYR